MIIHLWIDFEIGRFNDHTGLGAACLGDERKLMVVKQSLDLGRSFADATAASRPEVLVPVGEYHVEVGVVANPHLRDGPRGLGKESGVGGRNPTRFVARIRAADALVESAAATAVPGGGITSTARS